MFCKEIGFLLSYKLGWDDDLISLFQEFWVDYSRFSLKSRTLHGTTRRVMESPSRNFIHRLCDTYEHVLSYNDVHLVTFKGYTTPKRSSGSKDRSDWQYVSMNMNKTWLQLCDNRGKFDLSLRTDKIWLAFQLRDKSKSKKIKIETKWQLHNFLHSKRVYRDKLV